MATIVRLTRKLARRIADSSFQPDIVVAIARGGYVPARLLCDCLNLYNLTSIRIAHYTGAEKGDAAELCDPLKVAIAGMQVLLVDDVDDSGDTLQLALEHLRHHQPATIKVAVLHHKQNSTLVPDFFAQKIIRWRWLTYPWAVVEDVLGFVKKMDPPPTSVEQASEHLAREYGLKISRDVLEDVFRLL